VINAVRSTDAPGSLAAGKRYNGQDVVDALLRDFRGKCYLCESRLSRRQHSVDHRRPQAQFPELAFVWSNLFPSCRDCNERRPAYPIGGLLDPTSDDVEAQLHQTLQYEEGRGCPRCRVSRRDRSRGRACAAATARELESPAQRPAR
jgi:hypothetical protein